MVLNTGGRRCCADVVSISDTELLAGFDSLDSSTVSDALDAHGLPVGSGVVGPVWGHPRVAGFATTVQLDDHRPGAPGPHIGTTAVDRSGDTDVLVVANRGRTDVSSWGGLLSLGASRRGVRGVVVDGVCRDVAAARELAFPVFARGSVPTSARGRLRQVSTNEPVRFCEVRVGPGDVVVADETGVVFVPRPHAAEVLRTALDVASRETAVEQDIRRGRSMQESMHDARLAGRVT